MPSRRPRKQQQQLPADLPPVVHAGIPCPKVMADHAHAEGRGCSLWPPDGEGARRRRMLEAAESAYWSAYYERALMCPVRYERRTSSWRCRQCGVQDQYERIIPAWLTLRSEGNPDDEREVWTSEIDDTATIRCLACGYDDDMEEIPRPAAALPDWSIGLDGKEREKPL